MESELIASETTSSEAELLRDLLADLPIVGYPPTTASIHCDC